MLEIITKVDEFVKKHNMISCGDFIVVGVSGGADSMLLLNYLLSKRDEYHLRILVANAEHGIRGKESVEDTEFVKAYCKDKQIEFQSISFHAVEEAKKAGMGVEAYSRQRRYDFFSSFNPDKIATAHNLSDNIETVLFRIARGTSIKGCCGIPAVRGNIIRPLLNCSGDEIRNACRDNHIPFRIDSTNNEDDYTRNYIRHNIIPAFERINPSFEKAVSRLIDSVKDDESILDSLANDCFDNCLNNNYLALDKLNGYSPSIMKRTIIKFFDMYGISLDELHLNGAYKLTEAPGRFQIKNNIFAVSDKTRFRIAVFNENIDFDEFSVNKRIISYTDFLNNCELFKRKFDFFCDYDKIVGNIEVRPRYEGDRISPAGRACTKSIKKLFNELKINVEDRANIPVLCDENGVIGIYGCCCDERVKIESTTNNILMLKINLED